MSVELGVRGSSDVECMYNGRSKCSKVDLLLFYLAGNVLASARPVEPN